MTPTPLFPSVPLLAQITICVLGILVVVLFALYATAVLRLQNAEEELRVQREIIDRLRTHADELYHSVQAASAVAGEMRKELIRDPYWASDAPQVRRWMEAIQRATNVSAPDASKGEK